MAVAVFTSLQQLCDDSGDPLNGGSVTVYQDGTTTPIQLYSADSLAGGTEATNPITLDAFGRHAMTYFTAESYKVLVKDSAGTTIFTRDDIDPNVPLGSGILAIANGGTGASVAATALSNLGGATSAEVAAVAADVAALAGAASSTEKTHIATGTTAQRPSSPIEGDIRRNSQTTVWELYNGSAYQNIVLMPTAQTDPSATDTAEGLIELAIQSEMETGTDVVRAVTPGRQQFHASAAKVWINCDIGGNTDASYNVTSIADSADGIVDVTIATDFSGIEYATVLTAQADGNVALMTVSNTTPPTAGTFRTRNFNAATSAGADTTEGYNAICFGDQA